MTFAVASNPSTEELAEAVNYLLSNFSQTMAINPNTGRITTANYGIVSYLYKYLQVRYADSYDGSVNFSNLPTNRLYYGIRNDDSPTESTNPADYLWLPVTGGFGTTKFFWYNTTGGRQIETFIGAVRPSPNFVKDTGNAIDLDLLTTSAEDKTDPIAVNYSSQIQALEQAIGSIPQPQLGTMAPQNAENVAITGGAINGTSIGATTPSTGGFSSLVASTSVTTPIVQASNSAGLSLKNTSGTTQMSVGAGGGDNMSINVSTNLNGTNAQIDISPTGTGHVHMKPTGTGSIEIAPTNVGTIDNMTIGTTTAKNANFVDLSVTGTLSFDAAQGTAGQVLTSSGTGVTPTWTTPTTGTVASVTGTAPIASTGGTTPVISISQATTSTDGYLSSTDWNTFNNKQSVSAPITKTADFTVANGDIWYINNKSGSTCTVTLPAASSWTGRSLTFKNMQAQTLVSASSNVVPIDSTTAGTAILLGVIGNWATMVSDGTNWVIMQAASNNNLLLE